MSETTDLEQEWERRVPREPDWPTKGQSGFVWKGRGWRHWPPCPICGVRHGPMRDEELHHNEEDA